MNKYVTTLTIATAILGFAETASAQEGLGQEEGQIAISSDLQLEFSTTSSKPPQGDSPDAVTKFLVMPALDFFLAEGISIGGQVGYALVSQGDNKVSGIMAGARIGYAIPLTEELSFWPKVGLIYINTSTIDTSGNKIALQGFAPFTYAPADHFFIGLGPVLQTDLTSKVEDIDANKDTTLGVASVVGGYF